MRKKPPNTFLFAFAFTRSESERGVVCIVGLVLNGIRVLDLAKERDDRVQIEGDVSLVLSERAPPHKG